MPKPLNNMVHGSWFMAVNKTFLTLLPFAITNEQ